MSTITWVDDRLRKVTQAWSSHSRAAGVPERGGLRKADALHGLEQHLAGAGGEDTKAALGRRIVLVSGAPRSGTTPVGSLLAMAQGASMLHESMNVETGDRRVTKPFPVPGSDGFAESDLHELVQDICDVTRKVPSALKSVDLITCYSGIEHFADNRAFLENAHAMLRPGGYMLAQFPGAWSPHAVLNRLMPERFSARLLRLLIPGSDEECGFKAHYDRTRYSQFRAMAESCGFEVDYHFPGYFSSAYFAFFTPFYLIHFVYDCLRFSIGWRDLASYNLFVLRKPGGDSYVIWTDDAPDAKLSQNPRAKLA